MKNNKNIWAGLALGMFASGCITEIPNDLVSSSSNKFDINAYQETDQNADITGTWIAIHEGTLHEYSGNVNYTVTGFIREIVQIREDGGQYYLRSCLHPESENLITITGDSLSVDINKDRAELTIISQTAFSGTASHNTNDSDYSGNLAMRKVAALDHSFGRFDFYNASHATETIDHASCFQEGNLQVVGSMVGVSQWSNINTFTVSSWQPNGEFNSLAYLFSYEGSADPVRQLMFSDGTVESPSLVQRQYEDTLSIAISSSNLNRYTSTFSIDGITQGSVDLNFDIDIPGYVSTDPNTSPETQPDPGNGNDWGSWLLFEHLGIWADWLGLGSWWEF